MKITTMLHIYEEAARCLLCEEAPCTRACAHGDPARAIRAIRFDNARNIGRWVADCSPEDLRNASKLASITIVLSVLRNFCRQRNYRRR